MFEEEKKLWVKFACSALNGCVSTMERRIDEFNKTVESPEDWIEEYDVIQEDCDFAAAYADKMVSIFQDKFKDC